MRRSDLPNDDGHWNSPELEAFWRGSSDHPCEVHLRKHVLDVHVHKFEATCFEEIDGRYLDWWDVYKAAIAFWERLHVPCSGVLLDRRLFQRLEYVYNDNRIRSLICMFCAQIKLDSGGSNSDIQFQCGSWLLQLPPRALMRNASMQIFRERYCRSGSPLATIGNLSTQDIQNPSFTEWSLTVYSNWMERMPAETDMSQAQIQAINELTRDSLICCPEDHECSQQSCVTNGKLCPQCKIPVCRYCRILLQTNKICPEALINDNFIGYLADFIFHLRVTWMEKTVTSPYWTGLTLFSIGTRGQDRVTRKRHKLDEAMYMSEQRVAFKGQLFSAPMDWLHIHEQIQELDAMPRVVDLPVSGEILTEEARSVSRQDSSILPIL